MKYVTFRQIAIIIGLSFLIAFNVLYLIIKLNEQSCCTDLNKTHERMNRLYQKEELFEISKSLKSLQYMYESYPIGNQTVYIGADSTQTMPLKSLINEPKLVFGTSYDMCPPCINGVIDKFEKVFPDYKTNENIIFIYLADSKVRVKNNYHGKKVLSFSDKTAFPLYNMGMPYLFIIDKNLTIKMLFLSDKEDLNSIETYLKIVKDRIKTI